MSEYSLRKKKSYNDTFDKRSLYSTTRTVNPYGRYYEVHPKENFEDFLCEHLSVSRGKVTERNYLREIENLQKLVCILYQRLPNFERNFPDYFNMLEDGEPSFKKEVSIEEAKSQIQDYLRDYFENNEKVYPSDVADALKIDYEVVREAFAIMEKEGKLKESE
jgi:ASC-1-like (ASCH) protein